MLNKDYKEMLQILSEIRNQQAVKKIYSMQNISAAITILNITSNYEYAQTLYISVVQMHIL